MAASPLHACWSARGDHRLSCYDALERARDFAAAGRRLHRLRAYFPSTTKPNARRASLSLLRDAGPLVPPAGSDRGITPDNARPLVEAGADLIAVVSGVFDAQDPSPPQRACQAV